MIRILAFDQSLTRAGWCLLSGTRSHQDYTSGSFKSEDATHFGEQVLAMIDLYSPDRLVWERPTPRVMIYSKKGLLKGMTTPNANQLVLPQLAGMIEMAALCLRIPYESVPSNSWRARVLGKGYGNLRSDKAKAAAVEYCRRAQIAVANADQAEACLIALYGLTSDAVRLELAQIELREHVSANPLKVV